MNNIQINKLSMSFGNMFALEKVSLNIDTNGIHAIIGPNGAGKSTLLKLISGQLIPSSGSIYLDSKEITNLPIYTRAKLGISCTYQHTNLFDDMTTIENIKIALQQQYDIGHKIIQNKLNKLLILDQTIQILRKFNLYDYMCQNTNTLSYGHQKILEIAISFATKPLVLLLDEPTSGISLTNTKEMINLIKQISKTTRVILVEHDMDVIFNLADTITVLNHGKIIGQGTPSEIQKNPTIQSYYLGHYDNIIT
tara:strand:- start:552 stop:1307 length:756 start_codon:yes stop_codon:yes gene_type:complete